MTKQNLTRGKLLERNSKTVDSVIEFEVKMSFLKSILLWKKKKMTGNEKARFKPACPL